MPASATEQYPMYGGGYGAKLLYRGIDPLAITLTDCRIIPPTGKTIAQCITGVSAALWAAKDTNRTLALGAWSDRYWYVKFTGSMNVLQLTSSAFFSLEFVAEDPRAYATAATTITDTWTTGSYTEVITPVGSAPAEPIISIRSMYVDGTKTITLAGSLSQSTLTISSMLVHQGQWVRFDCRQDQQLVYRSSNYPAAIGNCVWVECMDKVSGLFPYLSPGAANTLTVTGNLYDANTQVVIVYNARYFG